MIYFPLIKVRDRDIDEDNEILVGSNHHHVLLLDKNGSISFLNMQCCEGTGKDGSYEFVSTEDEEGNRKIEMVNIIELLKVFGDEIHIKDLGMQNEFTDVLNSLENIISKAQDAQNRLQEEFMAKLFGKR